MSSVRQFNKDPISESNYALGNGAFAFRAHHFDHKLVEKFTNMLTILDPGFRILQDRKINDPLSRKTLTKYEKCVTISLKGAGRSTPTWLTTRTTEDDVDSDDESDTDTGSRTSLHSKGDEMSAITEASDMQGDADDDDTITSVVEKMRASDAMMLPPDIERRHRQEDADKKITEQLKQFERTRPDDSNKPPSRHLVEAEQLKLRRASEIALETHMCYYNEKYKLFVRRLEHTMEESGRKEDKIIADYAKLSTKGIAIMLGECTIDLQDKLKASAAFQKARTLPCIMGAFQVFLDMMKVSGSDADRHKTNEHKKLVDFMMDPEESAAAFQIRFMLQIEACLDAKDDLNRKAVLSIIYQALTPEYNALKDSLTLYKRGWRSTYTVPDLMYEIQHYEDRVLMDRRNQETQRASMSVANVAAATDITNAGPNDCLMLGRDGKCTRTRCQFDHSNPQRAALFYQKFMSTHKCAKCNSCSDEHCYWATKTDKKKQDKNNIANVAAGQGGLAGCRHSFVMNTAALDPFRSSMVSPMHAVLPLQSVGLKARMTQLSSWPDTLRTLDLSVTPHTHPDVAMLDSGCNGIFIRNHHLLNQYTECPPQSATIGSSVTPATEMTIIGTGKLPGPLSNIEGLVSPQLTANLLGDDALIARGWTIGASMPGNASRVIQDTATGTTVTFVRNHEGLLLCDLAAIRRASPAPMHTAVACTTATVDPECVTHMYAQGFSRDVVKRALLVDVLHQRLGYPGLKAMDALISGNRIADCKLTAADVRRYFDHLHGRLCVGCMRGKVKTYPQHHRDQPPPASVGELYGLDEVHITFKGAKDRTFLVQMGKDRMSGFRNIAFPRDATADTTVQFVVDTDKLYQEYGHKIGTVLLDPSAPHLAAQPKLEALGFKVQFCAVGRHVTWIECDIGVLKRALLAQLMGLPYRLDSSYFQHAIQYTVDSMNMLFAYNPVRTPMEIFLDQQITLEHYLSSKFGQLVISQVHTGGQKLPSSEARGEYGIVVDRDWKSKGSWLIRRIGPSSTSRTKLISRRDFAQCDLVTPAVRAWIEHPDDSLNDADSPLCKWHPADPDEICPQPPPSAAEIDLTDDQDTDEFVSGPDHLARPFTPESAPLTHSVEHTLRSEGDADRADHSVPPAAHTETLPATEEEPPWDITEAHLPDTDAYYDDSGKDLTLQEATAIAEELMPDSDKDQSIAEELTPDNDKDEATANPRRYNTRSVTNQELRHPPTVRRRLRNKLALKLTIKQARTEFGTEAAEEAVMAELNQLIEKHTWDCVLPADVMRRLREGEIVMPGTMFLKAKYDASNVFVKNKARLAVCGNFARRNTDLPTESPTASVTGLFLALEVAARERMTKIAADIGGAFLYGVSDQHHLMRLPKSVTSILVSKRPDLDLHQYVCNDGCIVVELNKTLYGLREASRAFHDIISSELKSFGLFQSSVDKCIFYNREQPYRIIVILYVDDLLIMATRATDCIALVEALRGRFEEVTVKDGATLSFLGMEIVTDEQYNVSVGQSSFIRQILEEERVTDTAPTPATAALMKDYRDDEPTDRSAFYSLTMKLMYAAVRTRPDILYAVGVLAGRVQKPTTGDRACLDHVLRYLNGTCNDGLVYRSDATWRVSMSVDASFNHHYDAKGHSGMVIFAAEGSAGILVKSFEQKTVANSSCEAELIALHDGVLYLLWTLSIYQELGYQSPGAVEIGQDNQAAIMLSREDPVNFRGRSKFINRMYFSVYEHVESGAIELVHVGTADTIADLLTKALIGNAFRKFKIVLMGYGDE